MHKEKFNPEKYNQPLESRKIPGGGGWLPYEKDGNARRLAQGLSSGRNTTNFSGQ